MSDTHNESTSQPEPVQPTETSDPNADSVETESDETPLPEPDSEESD